MTQSPTPMWQTLELDASTVITTGTIEFESVETIAWYVPSAVGVVLLAVGELVNARVWLALVMVID